MLGRNRPSGPVSPQRRPPGPLYDAGKLRPRGGPRTRPERQLVAYSRSAPTGSPEASRVTATSARARGCRRRCAVPSPRRSWSGLVAITTSRACPSRTRAYSCSILRFLGVDPRSIGEGRRRARDSARGTRACARSRSRQPAPRPRKITSASRRSSSQIRQRGPSARLSRPHRSRSSA